MNEMLDNAEFENEMRNMTDRQLSEFVARQVSSICKTCKIHEKRIRFLENVDKRMLLIGSGIGMAGAGLAEGATRLYKILIQ